jgi:hypothetical protein
LAKITHLFIFENFTMKTPLRLWKPSFSDWISRLLPRRRVRVLLLSALFVSSSFSMPLWIVLNKKWGHHPGMLGDHRG